MKNNEVLRYPLADIGPESPVMTVYLHRTLSGYWSFGVRYNHQIDLADRLFDSLADHAGVEEKVLELFNSIPRKGRFYPCLMSSTALFARGKFFPDRDSVVNLVEKSASPLLALRHRQDHGELHARRAVAARRAENGETSLVGRGSNCSGRKMTEKSDGKSDEKSH